MAEKQPKHYRGFVRYGNIQEIYYTHACSVKKAKRNIKITCNERHGRVPEAYVTIELVEEIPG